MKSYKVWVEIEEYDSKTEEGKTVDGLMFSATAEFRDFKTAEAFAEQLNTIGLHLVTWGTRAHHYARHLESKTRKAVAR